MFKKFVVRLTADEQGILSDIITKGKSAAYKIKHANILLKADADGLAWTDQAICQAFDCSLNTVRSIRQRFIEEGLEIALNRKHQSRPSNLQILDGEKEARLIALCCAKPPEGRSGWSLRLLADRLVELEIVKSISYETVRLGLKKTNSNLTCGSAG